MLLFDRLKFYYQFEQLLNPNNRHWWLFELIMITIQTGRFLFYVWLSFMDESVIRSYCQYDTTAAPLFDYHNHDNDGTSLNITDSCLTSIIWSIYFGFVLHSHYMLFLTNRNSLTWHLLYDISIRNYDHYRNSIVQLQGENMLRTIIKTLNNSDDFNELISDSSPRIIHNYLAKMLRKKHKTFIDKLFMLEQFSSINRIF